MPMPSKPYSAWKKEDLDCLLEDPAAEENARVDFKAESMLLSDGEARKKARRDILKDISAMANGRGGALLLGVRQSQEGDAPPRAEKIVGVAEVEKLKQAIAALVDTHLQVRPASLRFWPVAPTDDNGCEALIIQVPQNTYSLSMVTFEQINQFWVRRGTDNKLMMTDEIQYAIESMGKARQAAERELEHVRSRLREMGKRDPVAWFAAVPYARSRDHIPVNVEMLRQILTNSSYFEELPKKRGMYEPGWYANYLQPSLTGLGLTREGRDSALLEIGRDGTLVFAFRLHEADMGVPLDMLYGVWCSALYLRKDLEERFQLSPVAVAQSGLYGPTGTTVRAWGHSHPGTLDSPEIALDVLMTDEDWSPKLHFDIWARQFANCLHMQNAIRLSPWVP